MADIKSGWVQVNNTVVPFIDRHASGWDNVTLVPRPVLTFGADLDLDPNLLQIPATPQDHEIFTECCKQAGIDFDFPEDMTLVMLDLISKSSKSKIVIRALPKDDPFTSAVFIPELEIDPPEVEKTPQSSDSPVLEVHTESSQKKSSPTEPLNLAKSEGNKSFPGDIKNTKSYSEAKQRTHKQKSSTKSVSNKGCAKRVTDTPYYKSKSDKKMDSDSHVKVFGKSVPYISTKDSKYIKMDTLHNVFFSQWSFSEFFLALTSILQSPLSNLGNITMDPIYPDAIQLQDVPAILTSVYSLLQNIHIAKLQGQYAHYLHHYSAMPYGLTTPSYFPDIPGLSSYYPPYRWDRNAASPNFQPPSIDSWKPGSAYGGSPTPSDNSEGRKPGSSIDNQDYDRLHRPSSNSSQSAKDQLNHDGPHPPDKTDGLSCKRKDGLKLNSVLNKLHKRLETNK